MNPKSALLVAVPLLLACVYVRYFTDWFRPKPIQIFPQVRPVAGRTGAVPVAFMLDRKHTITSVKVHSLSGLATNELAPPVWSLTSDSNSVPVKGIFYGETVDGMRALLPAQPLLAGEKYRITVEAEGRTGKADFQTYETVRPARAGTAPPPPPSPFK